MATRIGIELSPAACRIVEIEAPGWRGGGDIRVRSFSEGPRLGGETMTRLAALRGRQAAVVAWGIRGEYRQTIVTADRYEMMRKEAVASLEYGGIDMRGVLTDIAPAGPSDANAPRRRPVLMALASQDDMAAALRPLQAAGIRVRSVVTPAAALASLARSRRTAATRPGVEAYVALEEAATCIALIRDHVLVAATDLPWGYVEEHEPFGECATRSEIAARLADELAGFFAAARVAPSAVTRICMCGGAPDLRSMTAPMMERLDVEIEPLDSLFGIDAEQLPEPAGEFRERSVALRLAWAIAADWQAPLNLLRERRRHAAAASFARAAVVAGVGAGVGIGWGIQRAESWQPVARTPVTRMASIAPALRRAETTAPRTTPTHDARAVPPPAPAVVPPAPAPPVVAQPVVAPLVVAPSVAATVVVAPPVTLRPPATAAVQPRPRQEMIQARQPPLVAQAKSNAPEHVLPFDGVLGTILFGPDRQLAIVNGRIVEAGDAVSGGRIVEITPTAVILRDDAGRLRRLSLASTRR